MANNRLVLLHFQTSTFLYILTEYIRKQIISKHPQTRLNAARHASKRKAKVSYAKIKFIYEIEEKLQKFYSIIFNPLTLILHINGKYIKSHIHLIKLLRKKTVSQQMPLIK